ncbi:restriction endonuclease subunit S [Roseburia hominis]|uniref:restriction endonuclease subunit S n=1 Tax=Roseburia hominis TaxID=301301 RepID=UPI00307FA68B
MVNEILKTDIPDDWSVITLGNYAQIFRGGSPRPIQAFLTTSDKGVNWIKIGDVGEEDKFIKSTEEKIVPEGVSRSRMVFRGDLILSNSMSYGRPYIMNIEGCIHDGWLVIQKYDRVFDRDYLYYALSSGLTMKQYVAMAAGSSVQNLNKEKVSKIVLPCPRISEQKSIAEVLSDIDTLIIDLKKLIRKKKDIRQGTMQMLVTGKKRLDGFSGDWVKINLAKNSRLKARIGWQGLTTAEYLDEGYSYLITGTDFKDGRINWNGCHYVNYDRYVQDPNIQVSNGDLLLTKDGTIGKVAYISDLNRPATLNSGVFVVKPITDAYTAHFMFYVLESSVFKEFLQQLSAGSTINHLYQKDLVKFDLYVPPTTEEQEAIIGILCDMDLDIYKLEEKLSKYQKIKQGMMDELLTGKVRLV